MSDTPRTDNYQSAKHGYVAVEFARRLERENAKLRDVLTSILAYEGDDMGYTVKGQELIDRARALLKS